MDHVIYFFPNDVGHLQADHSDHLILDMGMGK
jgi:hypothetical protein